MDTPPAGGVPRPSPGTFLKIGSKWCLWAHFFFCTSRVDFSSKIVCNFCLQSSGIGDAGELTPQFRGSYKVQDWQEGIFYLLTVGSGVRGFTEFFFNLMQMMYSKLQNSCWFLQKKLCVILPSNLRLPIYVMRENFHLSCRGSYKEQEGRFVYSLAVGGGVSPRKFLKKKWCKWSILSLFCRLIVNIFSKIVWDFCDDPEDTKVYVMREYVHLL